MALIIISSAWNEGRGLGSVCRTFARMKERSEGHEQSAERCPRNSAPLRDDLFSTSHDTTTDVTRGIPQSGGVRQGNHRLYAWLTNDVRFRALTERVDKGGGAWRVLRDRFEGTATREFLTTQLVSMG